MLIYTLVILSILFSLLFSFYAVKIKSEQINKDLNGSQKEYKSLSVKLFIQAFFASLIFLITPLWIVGWIVNLALNALY